ncbi:MAG: hypothetical protein JW871_02450 [Endomicrobiales bacterium]|nr:hypothetical protein [Endomicrobiales bacterium]
MGLFPIDEIKRKTFHFLTIFYIIAYWFLPRTVVIWGMALLITVVVIGEIVRFRFPAFNNWILKVLMGVHREEEVKKISGLPWTLSGSFLTMLIFPDKRIVLVSLLYLAFGDAFAALFGRRFGRHKIFRQKSLEGSVACFIACLIIGIIFMNWQAAILGALFITALELIPWPLNDNFWLPPLSALFLHLLKNIL